MDQEVMKCVSELMAAKEHLAALCFDTTVNNTGINMRGIELIW